MFSGLSNNYKELTGLELEILTSAIFQSLNYFTDVNLTWMEEREDSPGASGVLEIDVLAKEFSPLKISNILAECKRGCDFNDFFKFLGIAQFMKVDSKYLICQSNQFAELYKLGLVNNVSVVEPDNIVASFSVTNQNKLTLLRGVNTICASITDKSRIREVLNDGATFSQNEREAYNCIRKYLISLDGWIWKESDSRIKQKKLFELMQSNKGFVNSIAAKLGLTRDVLENHMRDNPLCTAAGYAVLQTKISYIVCAVECAINSLISPDDNYLTEIRDVAFIKCVEHLKSNMVIACKLPKFVQLWVNVFGGMINYGNSEDVELIASFFEERNETITDLIDILDVIFSIFNEGQNIQWGFIDEFDIRMFRYVPRAIKGVGITYRKRNGIDIEDYCFAEEWEKELKQKLVTIELDLEES